MAESRLSIIATLSGAGQPTDAICLQPRGVIAGRLMLSYR